MSVTIRQVDDLTDAHALRHAVFIEEQGISEPEEWDDLDAGALHLVAYEGDVALGTARCLIDGTTGRIGRICVARAARGRGLGADLVRAGEAALAAKGVSVVRLGAQVQAMPFYTRLGYAAIGPVYDDAGIPHREMEKPL